MLLITMLAIAAAEMMPITLYRLPPLLFADFLTLISASPLFLLPCFLHFFAAAAR